MRSWCLVKWRFRDKEESAPLNVPVNADGSPDRDAIKKTLTILLDDSAEFVSAEPCAEPSPVKVDYGWSDM